MNNTPKNSFPYIKPEEIRNFFIKNDCSIENDALSKILFMGDQHLNNISASIDLLTRIDKNNDKIIEIDEEFMDFIIESINNENKNPKKTNNQPKKEHLDRLQKARDFQNSENE